MTSLALSRIYRQLLGRSSTKLYTLQTPVRNLNLLEYQSKKLLAESGVAIQAFRVLEGKKDEAILKDFNVNEYVVKAQILAGGRGKGHFDNGFKGGVHITKERSQVIPLVEKMVGAKLITKQTPKDGILVKKVMVADSINIVRETYLSIVMDRENNGPVMIASPAGGMDIEAVAEKTPEKIKTVPIPIVEGISRAQAEEVARFLEFKGPLVEKAASEIEKLYKLFVKVDATQIEINPLAETDDGRVISVDAKLNFDDNAEFRQKEIFAMDVHEDTDPKELEASRYNLNYIAMEGNIGCLVNGAGLAMATMDIIKLNGGSPANFLDVGGNVKEDQVLKAFQILTSDQNVKAILVNVFGGIVNCATIANGIVNATKTIGLQVPLVVRLEGTNVHAAKKILQDSGLKIESAIDLDDAARKAVRAIN
ncbi:succinate--CoA ligase [GDP-forming] subunit beta, mitochondrial [Sabethes cyaneus]|uniref:succinate--CoA ligase [GDP-forming] subunit beta, mitochondrial n=1 Tax=Sabethes cyaneus TaxID=53552 RepID=UPI00221E352D|nr:succinate--CoA ligase [GDP-forming] subunit beta, mitochondrial [Sabethes cyaneus]XP_053695025.1 succinate--CoA ligase [GDP-forming] subunit beta, mitochondrial [Sabethes cyaneus]